jgi:hypothetical protein
MNRPAIPSSPVRVTPRIPELILSVALGAAALGCEEPPTPEPLKNEALKLEPVIEDKPKQTDTPPLFEVDDASAKISHSRYLLDRPEGKAKLEATLSEHAKHIDGKELAIKINRKAQLPWVTTLLAGLEAHGANGFEITTETRREYPSKLSFSTTGSAKNAAACSVVAMIQEDRSTVVWKLGGGGARKRGRGLGGPDLSTTALSMESVAGACKASDTLFVGAHEVVEWGLVYDLAASSTKLEEQKFAHRVLLHSTPKPGKKISP